MQILESKSPGKSEAYWIPHECTFITNISTYWNSVTLIGINAFSTWQQKNSHFIAKTFFKFHYCIWCTWTLLTCTRFIYFFVSGFTGRQQLLVNDFADPSAEDMLTKLDRFHINFHYSKRVLQFHNQILFFGSRGSLVPKRLAKIKAGLARWKTPPCHRRLA